MGYDPIGAIPRHRTSGPKRCEVTMGRNALDGTLAVCWRQAIGPPAIDRRDIDIGHGTVEQVGKVGLDPHDVLATPAKLSSSPRGVVVVKELPQGAGPLLDRRQSWQTLLDGLSDGLSRVRPGLFSMRCSIEPSVRRFPCCQVTTHALCPLGWTRRIRPLTRMSRIS